MMLLERLLVLGAVSATAAALIAAGRCVLAYCVHSYTNYAHAVQHVSGSLL
jgi:hypothetical protein